MGGGGDAQLQQQVKILSNEMSKNSQLLLAKDADIKALTTKLAQKEEELKKWVRISHLNTFNSFLTHGSTTSNILYMHLSLHYICILYYILTSIFELLHLSRRAILIVLQAITYDEYFLICHIVIVLFT